MIIYSSQEYVARTLFCMYAGDHPEAPGTHGLEAVRYSTCSLHRAENEDVVEKALVTCGDFQVVPAMPSWRNGPAETSQRPLPNWAHLCLRCVPDVHHCHLELHPAQLACRSFIDCSIRLLAYHLNPFNII